MGVVDDGDEVLALIDEFHATRHAHIAHGGREDLIGDAEHMQGRPCCKPIRRVEATRESHDHVVLMAPAFDKQALLAEVVGDASALDIGLSIKGERRERELGANRQLPPPGIVDADDGTLRSRGGEERRLRLEVVLHRPVEVQVILREVGEDGGIEDQSVDSAEGERMARHLHGDRVNPPLAHGSEQCVQVGRLRRGARTGELLIAKVDPRGADHAGREPRRAQSGLEQERGRRLAVRAGDTHQQQVVARSTVDLSGEVAQERAGIIGNEHGPIADRLSPREVGEDGDGPTGDRLVAELRSVCVRTGERGEEVARLHRSRVQGDARDQHPTVDFGNARTARVGEIAEAACHGRRAQCRGHVERLSVR